MHFAVLVDGIDLTIVVEKHTEIVDVTLHVVMRPRALDIFRGIALQALTVDVGKHIELAVGIADARRPDALAVDFLMVLQSKTVLREVKAVEAVRGKFPVHKILGVEYNQTRNCVHRRASKVIVISHTDNVRIRKLIIEQRICECAVAIVSRPCLLLCMSAYGNQYHPSRD